MKIAVHIWKERPISIAGYTDAITSGLRNLGGDLVFFGESDPVPDCADLYWDPGTGRPGPHFRLRDVTAPLAVTFHGAANLSLPVRDCNGPGAITYVQAIRARRATRQQWQSFSGRSLSVTAVSEYARQEAVARLALNPQDVTVAYHGVSVTDFSSPPDGRLEQRRFFLHVSRFQPKKNTDAVIEAYQGLEFENGPELDVLEGGRETLARFRPKLLMEMNLAHLKRAGATAEKVFSLLSSFGYSIARIEHNTGLTPLRGPVDFTDHQNILALNVNADVPQERISI